MAKTFANFKSELKLMFGMNAKLDDVDGTNMYESFINYAYMRLTTRDRFFGVKTNFYFPELETVNTSTTTTDGTQYIDVPSDCIVTRDLYDYTNSRYLTNISWREYLKYEDRFDTNAEGEPTEWVRSGDYYYLHPTPDTSSEYIYIYYRKRPAALSGTNATAIGEEWDEAILQLAFIIGKGWMQEGQKPEVDAVKKEFLDNVSGLVGIYYQESLARDLKATPDDRAILGHPGYRS